MSIKTKFITLLKDRETGSNSFLFYPLLQKCVYHFYETEFSILNERTLDYRGAALSRCIEGIRWSVLGCLRRGWPAFGDNLWVKVYSISIPLFLSLELREIDCCFAGTGSPCGFNILTRVFRKPRLIDCPIVQRGPISAMSQPANSWAAPHIAR